MPRALDGLLVVSVEQAVAAPYCSARLADAGARVIKIERPEGDFARGYDSYVHGLSSYFVWLNRGKQSLVADFKQLEDAALLHRILARADAFIQNLAPGAAARAGFGSEALREAHPGAAMPASTDSARRAETRVFMIFSWIFCWSRASVACNADMGQQGSAKRCRHARVTSRDYAPVLA